MSRPAAFLALCLLTAPLAAQEVGTAGGRGTITRQTGWDKKTHEPIVEPFSFSPKFSYSYTEQTETQRFRWIVLTDKEPPLERWEGLEDQSEARRLWCEHDKAAFVAVKLDAQGAVELYFLCPANGYVNTEMLSTWNGLQSVVVTLDGKDPKRIKGTLRGGDGSCPDEEGNEAYCTLEDDYTFDAPLR